MAKIQDNQTDYSQNPRTFQELIIKYQDRTMHWLCNMVEPQEIVIAEQHMKVLKETLRPDPQYRTSLSVLNKDYDEKVAAASKSRNVKLSDLQIDYAIDHYGILMELLKRKGYVILAKGTVLFESMADFKQDVKTD